ncbi:hypothetical protein [Emergencia sp.]|uniref:hypothetical protein n=1 Tax=Emergencia sp. TaxID=1926557 RepID=UPI003AF0E177
MADPFVIERGVFMVLDTYNYVMNHRLLRVMVLAFMIFSIIFCGAMVEYSHAIVWAIPAIEVVATILIACGVISATDTDLKAVATAFYNSLAGQALLDVVNIAGTFSEVTSGNFTFKATKAIVNAVADWIADIWEESGNLVLPGGGVVIDDVDLSFLPVISSNTIASSSSSDIVGMMMSVSSLAPYTTYFPKQSPYTDYYLLELPAVRSLHNVGISDDQIIGTFLTIYTNDSVTAPLPVEDSQAYSTYYDSTGALAKSWRQSSRYRRIALADYDGVYRLLLATDSGSYAAYDFVGTTTTFPRTEVKSDTTYFPKEVTDAAAGSSTAFPSNTASKPLTTETPLTIPETGVNSNTGVGDVRTDAGTAEGEQTGTIIGWLEMVWDGVCAIPDAIAGAGTAVIDFVTDLVVPSDTVWDDFMADVVDIVSPPNTVNFNKYVSSIAIPDVKVNWKGQTLTIVDNGNLRDNVTTWRKYIGAFLAVLLIIYNYNMFMKLMGLGTLTLTESGRVPDVSINNLSGNAALPVPKGKR